MSWIILLGSAVFEAVWAVALSESQGFTKLIPSIVFVVASIISMIGLGMAMKTITVGTAYAVWTGTGASLTVIYAVITGAESLSLLKGLFLAGIVACVIGLKLADSKRPASTPPA